MKTDYQALKMAFTYNLVDRGDDEPTFIPNKNPSFECAWESVMEYLALWNEKKGNFEAAEHYRRCRDDKDLYFVDKL